MELPAGFWNGAGGALVGTVVSFILAMAVLALTQRHERFLMREQMSLRAAAEAQEHLHRLREQADSLAGAFTDWSLVRPLVEECHRQAGNLYRLRGLLRPAEVDEAILGLWESLLDEYPKRFASALRDKDAHKVDLTARKMGDHCVSVEGDIARYMKREFGTHRAPPLWRQYRFDTKGGFPWVRRIPPRGSLMDRWADD